MFYPIIAGSGFFLLYGIGKILSGVYRFRRQRLISTSTAD